MNNCSDCNEYDKENLNCPKWCEVIKGTIEDARADERAKVLKAVIDCGWHCEVHSDRALYEMVEIELKEVQNEQ